MAIKVEITMRETIKPSSPTPPDLKILKLSFLDQLAPVSYIPLLFFYPIISDTDHLAAKATERSQLLKTTLSETLTHFYSLAGRLKDNAHVECNDDGAEFIEARINCHLSDILKQPDATVLRRLLPAAIESSEAATGCLLLAQANYFNCGGMAIGVCASHKITDAATLTTFIKDWSATALNKNEVANPLFVGASIFPTKDSSISIPPVELMQQKCVTKRLVFEALKIAALKAKVASERVPEPTRVEAVSALIWKCAMAASRSNLGFPRPSGWTLAANLRKRLEPALPERYAGNCVGAFCAKMEVSKQELGDLVGQLRKEKQEFVENYVKKLQGDAALSAILGFVKEFDTWLRSSDVDFYNCTSWCKFELYEADFGWGKPTWFSIASTTFKNSVVLIDARDGEGIEAWLTLSEEDMALFESNDELLEFAAVNPSVPLG